MNVTFVAISVTHDQCLTFLSFLFFDGKEILVKGLAESRTFQKFAVRTQAKIEEAQKAGATILNKGMETLNKEDVIAKASTQHGGPPLPPLRGIPGFLSAFVKEIRNDLGMHK
jgi:hypothetical protein